MKATSDPLARVQAMVSAWGETELFDTFDTSTSEVSPPNPLENCGFGHSRQFRHHGSEHMRTRDHSARACRHEAHQQASASRVVSYSSGVESVESVENIRKSPKDKDLSFDTSCFRVSKNGGQVSKTGRSAAQQAHHPTGIYAPAGLPAMWIDGVARLAETPCPARFPAARWAQVVTDAESFLHGWAAMAHRLGWPVWELFGCHGRAPWPRVQGMGLVLLLRGKHLAAMTAAEAVIRTESGSCLTYRRKERHPLHPAERCLIWELDDA